MTPETKGQLDWLLTHKGAGMTQRDIADAVGVSQATVKRRAKALRDGAEPVERVSALPKRPTLADTDPDASREARLVELRDMLYDAMQETSGGSLANLSKEYRATLAELDEVRAGDGEDDELAEFERRYRDGG